MAAPEFLAIGHVTLDLFGDEMRLGGGALYSAITAHRLGRSVAILTSHGADFPLDAVPSSIEVVTLEAPATTVFEYQETEGPRVMHVTASASRRCAAGHHPAGPPGRRRAVPDQLFHGLGVEV